MKEKTSFSDIRAGVGFLILFVTVLFGIFRVIAAFPLVRLNDDRIRIFSLARLAEGGGLQHFSGRLLGRYVLETEHGEIVLGNFSFIHASRRAITRIGVGNFENGRASHNLVVHGIVMPKDISISLNATTRQIQTLALNRQEIIVSGIPLEVSNFRINHPRYTADISMVILMSVRSDPGYVTLKDSTQIRLDGGGWGGLYMYKDTGIWEITRQRHGILIKPPNETEFTRYRSIRFGQDWGEFIGGVPWE